MKHMSGAEAIKQGLITEEEWQQAIRHPWSWVVLPNGQRIREIPWRGLEIEETEPESYDSEDQALEAGATR